MRGRWRAASALGTSRRGIPRDHLTGTSFVSFIVWPAFEAAHRSLRAALFDRRDWTGAIGNAEEPVTAIDRLIELDEQESGKQRERLGFLALLDSVFEALPDGLVVTDLTGNVILFNEKAEFMFGYHRSEVIGQKVEKLMPERARALHVRRRERYNRFDLSPHARTMGLGLRLVGIRSDGYEFPVDISIARMIAPRGVYNLALLRYSPRTADLAAAGAIPPEFAPQVEESDAGH
jgi:PAS domain S-box-containing protein